jgi:uncharacterized membrane protein YkoI
MALLQSLRTRTSRTVAIAAVAGIAVVGGGAALAQDDINPFRDGGKLDDGQHLVSEASVSPERAVEIAQGVADGRVDDVELDREGGRLVYEVEVGEADVMIDASDGSILSTNDDDQFDDDRYDDAVLPEGAISYDAAIEIARGEANGYVDGVDVELYGDRVVYSIEVGNQEVMIDALDGTIVATELDD